MRFLAIFAVVPAPTGPKCDSSVHISEKGSRQRSTAASVPPTIIARVPECAPIAPPDTGASTRSTAASPASSASDRAPPTLMVECTATTAPGRAVARMPSAPDSTSRTWSSSRTITLMTPAARPPRPASLQRRHQRRRTVRPPPHDVVHDEAVGPRQQPPGHGSADVAQADEPDRGHRATATALVSRYSSKPATPISRPIPDCLTPPKGTSGAYQTPPLIPRVPVRIRAATASARSSSAE